MQTRSSLFEGGPRSWDAAEAPGASVRAAKEATRLAKPKPAVSALHTHIEGPVPLEGPRWRGEYVRFPETREDAAYFGRLLHGVRTSVRDHFEPWLAQNDRGASSFRQMLQGMHGALTAEGYSGYVGGLEAEYRIGRGHLMMDSKSPSYRHWLSVNASTVPEIRNLDLSALPEGESEVHLEGLPPDARGTNRKTTDKAGLTHLYHQYVPISQHAAVLERMAARMDTASAATSSPAEKLAAMAEYHHLGIQAQLFDRVNNSLLMAQLNQLLHRSRLHGIPHGLLDYAALIQPLASYRPRFLEAVLAHNPGLREAMGEAGGAGRGS